MVAGSTISAAPSETEEYGWMPDRLRVSIGTVPYIVDPDNDSVYSRIITEALSRLDVAVATQYFPLKRAMLKMKAQEFDCFTVGLRDSPNWAKLGIDYSSMQFIGPINTITIKMYVHEDDQFHSVEDFIGELVAVDSSILNLRELYPPAVQSYSLIHTKSFVESLELVAKGRAKAALVYDIEYQALRSLRPGYFGKIRPNGFDLKSYDVGFVCKKDKSLSKHTAHLQVILDDMRETGQIDRISGSK
ncbi:hypothetical protein GCM10017044_10590 [Kordiimonas sediminis]|uniref:Uncharacterized protein n=2 Tax=Kordiimonas sediminis TaxID=1735581 RepID=A0A919ANM5_9PROT|nr:hypothetical protein GCM10017044_10590 [Kordiimonas sediminis]